MTARVLIYTVSRAEGTKRVLAAFESLRRGRMTAGAPHDWLLWANSPDVWKASALGWTSLRHAVDGGANVGQHVALRWVLDYARCSDPTDHGDVVIPQPGCSPRYDFIVKVDDDLVWETRNWLRQLLQAFTAVHRYSGKLAVIAPRIVGLINPIPGVRLRVGKLRLLAVPIAGGACRLHHLSFFDGYEPDCRRALGAGGDTTIAQHAEATHTPIFLVHGVTVRHDTQAQIAADPEYAKMHGVYQRIPYIPRWVGHEAVDKV